MHPYQADQEHRRAVLQAMLLVTIVSALLFAALNFPDGMFLVAWIQVALAAFAAGLLVVVRRTQRVQAWCLRFMLVLLSATILLLSRPDISPYAFIWLLVIPLVTHLLLGSRLGLWLSLGYMGAGGAIYLYRFGASPELVRVEVLANAVIAALTTLGMSHFYERTRERSELKLTRLATVDPLTGLANRARLIDVFHWEQAQARRKGTPLSLLMLDLDRFKRINDEHGHEAGDTVLVAFARMLEKRLRETDLISRFGGEEFLVLLNNTDGKRALAIAEELRQSLEQLAIEHQGKILKLTVSIGVAEYGPDGMDLDALSRVADERLYQAKAKGRNRVCGGPALRAGVEREAAADATS
ncbi:GGDEF domain-containing protein [Billgrantia kenyensis]|uniref:diguanylate cyclase n=1 Tax=Billgrantia kenyensis TaxID=321266 RepID=A0A7V9W555_9GAMM|nr:GGDEF domain-containing protein [Halomonas kenyensis]MBA2781249.1 GGDEF domain-containing protein [Halomonas kenyensis]MCG6663920.1 GGDEF domain-containing protein [Halomonas kenyensis]